MGHRMNGFDRFPSSYTFCYTMIAIPCCMYCLASLGACTERACIRHGLDAFLASSSFAFTQCMRCNHL